MNNKALWWTIGIIVVILLGVLLWWGNRSQQGYSSTDQSMTTVATTTATSTNPNEPTSVALQTNSSSTVAQVIAGLSGVSQFQALLANSGVALTGKGPFTVFVPLDSGFQYIAPGTVANMTAAQKKRLVEYHIVAGKLLNISSQDSGTIQALSKDTLNFNVHATTGFVQVNSSFALRAIKASNGIVYVITEPLLPPTQPQTP